MDSLHIQFLPNPCEHANILSKLFFVWAFPFLKNGYKHELQLNEMYEPLKHDRSEYLGNRVGKKWVKGQMKPKKSSLLSVIFATFWKDFLVLCFFYFLNDIVFRLGQPFLMTYLLDYFRNDKNVSKKEAWMFAGGILSLSFVNAIVSNHIFQISFHTGMQIRIAVCSMIYRKSLRLSQSAVGETSAGRIVNLLTNDVSRFDWSTYYINCLWISPLLGLTVGILLYNLSGWGAVIGVCTVFGTVPLLSYLGKKTSSYRSQIAQKTDERVRFMNEIISSIQVIKMYAWEAPFASLITHVRKMELKYMKKAAYIRTLYMTTMLITDRLAMFAVMIAVYFINGVEGLEPDKMFVISTYLWITAVVMSLRFSRAIGEIAEVFIAIRRLEAFFQLDEKPITNKNYKNAARSNVLYEKASISMVDVRARWSISENTKSDSKNVTSLNELPMLDVLLAEQQKPTLDKLNIEMKKGKLIGVIGPTGSGKSSLLQALLRELPLETGSIRIDGTISYACQEPWIFSASVRHNILFGEKFLHSRYDAVVKACALAKDFEQFENGDHTVVGDRGGSLSGGQKARINLARACYRNADIYLLDDPLSAVDAHVGTHIFEKCFGPNGYLANRGSTRILVTHQVHFLKDADWLVVLKHGKIEAQGSPADLYSSGIDFIDMVGITEPTESDNSVEISLRRKSDTLSRISLSTVFGFEAGEAIEGIEYVDDNATVVDFQLEESSKGKLSGSILIAYFKAGTNGFTLTLLLFTFVFVQFMCCAIDYFILIWTSQAKSKFPDLTERMCVYIQAALLASLIIGAIIRTISFTNVCIKISRNIHNTMLNGIISTSMRFFDINPAGRILNRFSKDLGVIDEMQPKSLFDATQCILIILGTVTVVVSVNYHLLAPVVILAAAFIWIRHAYLKTSKTVKRLEAIAKAPSITHLSTSLNGLATIRAFNKEVILAQEFDNLQDIHSACWYMSFTTTSLLGLSLDLLCTVFTGSIICYYMVLDHGTPVEKISLALSQAIGLTGILPWGVRQSVDVNTQLTSAERVLEYRDMEAEKQPKKPITVQKLWPFEGWVEFRSVYYRYHVEADPVLRDLSFVLKPCEKIGIVGRTGAGKSSLIGALFRLAPIEGEILIDGIDTSTVTLGDLRKRLAIIPQSPALFSGSLRRNLDPFDEYSDDQIWDALGCVQLKDAASDGYGLQSQVAPFGANYSVGQRQLLCLARAILRKNRILVLDEATANVDPQTDGLIQQTIRNQFTESTVLTIAHRLHTIIDSDRVMVLDFGRLIEFDKPHNLLQNPNGLFYGMVKALGDEEFDRLAEMAKNISEM